MPVREILVVGVMTAWALGVGRAVVRRLDRDWLSEPEGWAAALLVGLGGLAVGVLGLGMLGWLNGAAIAAGMGVVGLAVFVGGFGAVRMLDRRASATRTPLAAFGFPRVPSGPLARSRGSRIADRGMRAIVGVGLIGTFLTALAPVTDGDALCYHLQVPKVFLERGRVVYEPDLHETVYPLLVELLYVPALAWGGPVACRLVSWVFGVAFAGAATGLARSLLGRRAGWAGAIALLAPAVSNGMSAPLNDVALAACCGAALWALVRWLDAPGLGRAAAVGLLAGLAVGVKYPALVWVGLIGLAMVATAGPRRPRDLALVGALVLIVGGPWYARAAWHTGNPVHPFFRQVFGGAGLDEVLEPAKRPLPVTPVNLLTSLGPMTVDPDRFDSVSHQFGPVFLALLPGLLVLRPPRRVVGLAAFGMAFHVACLTQRQSMRFLLPALGPWSVAAAWVAVEAWRRSRGAGVIVTVVTLAVLAGEAGLAVGRARHGLPVLLGKESAADYLARREPTYVIGRWIDEHLARSARVVGQDHRGFYIPRPYTMELAHRRRTGLGGEAREIVNTLRERGFTHLLLCPPVPEDAVEFDPTLSRQLTGWLERARPLHRADLADADGVVRRYAIYELGGDDVAPRLAGGPTP
jgi:hypothetical protein